MIFKNIEFPRGIAMGAQVAPGWNTGIAQTLAGFEHTQQNWANSRTSYDVSFAVRSASEYQLVRAHFHTVRGRAYSFPFRDPLDHKVTSADGILMASMESPAVGFQLGKRYGAGVDAWERRIMLPDPQGLLIYRTRNGETTAADDGQVDFTDGSVFMAQHFPGDTYTWAGRFFTECRYDTDQLPAIIVDREGRDGELLVQCSAIPIVEVRRGPA